MEIKANWSWDNLRYFLAVAQFGTLSDAARHLGVSHSTVQRRVGAFESELQVSLFNRTANGYALTQAGSDLFKEVSQVQTTLESISRKIAGSDNHVSGEVVVTSTDTLCFFVLPRLILSLTDSHPLLNVRMDMLNGLSNVQNLEADIAVRTCTEPPADLIGRKVGQLEFAPCASIDYCNRTGIDRFPDSMEQHGAVILDDSFASAPFHQWMTTNLSGARRTTVVNGFLGAYGLCRAGLGIALLPSYVCEQTDELVKLESAFEPVTNDLWILSHSDLRSTERIKVVRQYLFDALSELFN